MAAAADWQMKANDELPAIPATLAAGTAVNLTGASVKFIMVHADANWVRTADAPKIAADATIVDAATGKVRYDWTADDTDTPGNYLAEWEVTFSDGRKQTFPTASYHTIAVLADLDDA